MNTTETKDTQKRLDAFASSLFFSPRISAAPLILGENGIGLTDLDLLMLPPRKYFQGGRDDARLSQ